MTLTRRRWLTALTGLFAAAALPILSRGSAAAPALNKPKGEWKRLLPADRYEILFEEGTEPPGSSPLDREKREGTFICAACFLPLFDSSRKYDSGTGWPSFWEPLNAAVATRTDYKLIFPRTEYHCARCGGHQGHIFKDGPQPTGLRYCNNGLALQFVARGDKLPELRA
ncbi:MAG: peptide-methionine (R)-S-oxide reductase MsrB [Rhodocyclaceae bacterium]|nr:peptide-methionine (R)-S-oxide reductase MsrB [Rhodocyclaceae bacterium]MCB1890890.1 peptide-methionine (R)-S-oxide reductase MsrB [Rhodocyclaceae bacterium]MCP5296163.1 peptide-methionine (R)-S-oxide reductase MsrB [Zoogloeaceae bacterium]MCW5595288.1 peptide-methionine (R)-S-oxide reductase MsrB [Rhodocyclaceae bacterium]